MGSDFSSPTIVWQKLESVKLFTVESGFPSFYNKGKIFNGNFGGFMILIPATHKHFFRIIMYIIRISRLLYISRISRLLYIVNIAFIWRTLDQKHQISHTSLDHFMITHVKFILLLLFVHSGYGFSYIHLLVQVLTLKSAKNWLKVGENGGGKTTG